LIFFARKRPSARNPSRLLAKLHRSLAAWAATQLKTETLASSHSAMLDVGTIASGPLNGIRLKQGKGRMFYCRSNDQLIEAVKSHHSDRDPTVSFLGFRLFGRLAPHESVGVLCLHPFKIGVASIEPSSK
jgi:hypothetical protein